MKYITSDKQEFDNQDVAEQHEADIKAKQEAEEKAKEKPQDTDTLKLMDNTGIALVCFPKQILEEDGIKSVSKAIWVKSLKQQKSEGDKEPVKEPAVQFTESASFNLEYTLNYLNWMKKQGATHIRLFVKKEEPLLAIAKIKIKMTDQDGIENDKESEIKLWLAPYMEN